MKLVPTQRRAAQDLESALEKNSNHQALIVLAGLSGIGKSGLIDTLESQLRQCGVKIVSKHELPLSNSNYTSDEVQNHNGPLITTATPTELSSFNIERLTELGREVYPIIMKGWSFDEITSYVTNLKPQGLHPEQVVEYSSGIPLIAELLAQDSNLTSGLAAPIAARRILLNAPHGRYPDEGQLFFDEYLQMPIPAQVVAALKKEHLYNFARTPYKGLGPVLESQRKLAREGHVEESPFFVVDATRHMYPERGSFNWLEIFAPELTKADCDRLKEAFGVGKWTADKAPRLDMFGGSMRKAVSYLKNEHGELHGGDAHVGWDDYYENFQAYFDLFGEGQFPIRPREGSWYGSFAIKKHEHEGLSWDVIEVGWAVESLLQQRAIPYVALNRLVEQCYAFDPSNNELIPMGEKPLEIKDRAREMVSQVRYEKALRDPSRLPK